MNYNLIIVPLISFIYMILISTINDIYASNGTIINSNNFNQTQEQISTAINKIRISGSNIELVQLVSGSFGGAISGSIAGGFVSSLLNNKFSID